MEGKKLDGFAMRPAREGKIHRERQNIEKIPTYFN